MNGVIDKVFVCFLNHGIIGFDIGFVVLICERR